MPSALCFDPLNPLTGPIFDPKSIQTVMQPSPLLSADLHLPMLHLGARYNHSAVCTSTCCLHPAFWLLRLSTLATPPIIGE